MDRSQQIVCKFCVGRSCLAVKVYVIVTKNDVDIVAPLVLNPQVGDRRAVGDKLKQYLTSCQVDNLM